MTIQREWSFSIKRQADRKTERKKNKDSWTETDRWREMEKQRRQFRDPGV